MEVIFKFIAEMAEKLATNPLLAVLLLGMGCIAIGGFALYILLVMIRRRN